MIDAEQLLAPISEEAPCGEDLSYDPDLAALETMIQGKAETQFSAAEEPNWKEVNKAAVALFERTKDLRAAIDLTLVEIKMDGWPGFAQGTAVLRGLMERYWTEFYPRLDPDDDNDPTERMNFLATLAAPEGTFGDPMRFLERLRTSPVCKSGRLGVFSLAKIAEAVEGKTTEGGETVAPDPTPVEGAFRDTPPEFLASVRTAVNESTANMKAVIEFLDETVPGQRPDLESLMNVLREAKGRLETFAPEEVAPEPGAEDGDLLASLLGDDPSSSDGDSARGAAAPRGGAPGKIGTREDVLAALDAVCAYYATQEPSSPVPALLIHARKMVGMTYLQIVGALTPDATPQVRITEEPSSDTA